MATEPDDNRRTPIGTLAALLAAALRLVFGAVAVWWRWAAQRETRRGKVLAFGAPVVAILFVVALLSSLVGEDGSGGRREEATFSDGNQAAVEEPLATPIGEPTSVPSTTTPEPIKLPEYRIVEVEDASHKALERSLSSYTLEELEALPVDKRFFYRIVVSSDVTTAQVRPMIDAILAELTAEDADLDEIVLFIYSDEGLIDGAFDVAMATWAPKGELGNITAHIASTNDREGYITTVEIKEDLEEYLLQRSLQETKFGISEEQRRQFFKDLVAAEDKAQAEADRLFPLDDPFVADFEANLTNNTETYDRLAEGNRQENRDQYNITLEQEREIVNEAFSEGWPLD